jgi:hypothetical protein
MRELKRVLLARSLWGLLLLLLAGNLLLSVTQDTHPEGFYAAYQTALTEFSHTEPEAGLEQIEAELKELSHAGLLHIWQSEQNPALRELLRAQCAEVYGENFETLVADGTLDAGQEALLRASLRREVLQTVQAQLVHLREYPLYLRQVQVNVELMSKQTIFNKPGSFSLRNIRKTGRDFPERVDLELGNDLALTSLATDEIGGYSLLVFILYLTLRLLDERRRGLWNLVHGAPEGRGRLALRRSLVLLGGKLLFWGIQCGGLGRLGRNVQSLAVFSDFPWVMPVWVWLLGYFLLKLLGMWLVGLTVWAVLQAVNHLPLAIAAAGGLLAVEYGLFRFLPDSFRIVFLRYVNLFALVDVPRISLHYLNLDLFGRPVQGFLLTLGLVPPLIGLLLGVNLLLAGRKKPVSRQNSILTLLDRLRVPFSKLAGHLRLRGMELFKLLWQQKGLAVLLALGWLCFSALEAPFPDTDLYETQIAGLAASMEGPITEETLTQVEEQLEMISNLPPTEAVLRQADLLQQLRERVVGSLEEQDGLWLVNQLPAAALMGKNVDNYQRKNALLLLLALVLLLSGIFARERQSGITPLLHGTLRGRGALWRAKLLAAGVGTVLVWLIFEAAELRMIRQAYGTIAWAAPAQSFDGFADLPFRVSLGAGVAGYLLLRLLGLFTAAAVILLLSALCRQTNAALLLSCAVVILPAALSSAGRPVPEALSLSPLLSPMEPGLLSYAAALGIILAACAATRVLWARTANSK